MAAAVSTCVKSSLDVFSNVFIEIVCYIVVNKGACVHMTQLEVLPILGEQVGVMEFVHNNLTQIGDGLSR